MCSTYTCSRRTKRWPICIFYGMVTAGSINSWVIYNENMRTNKKQTMRRKYVTNLSFQLISPWAKHRAPIPTLSRAARNIIIDLYNIEETNVEQADIPVLTRFYPMKRCNTCTRREDKKTKYRCCLCQKPVCTNHFHPVCLICHK
ncbi:UNVERIFIED_CONTAM: hypothetical protein RMT77_016609 [Armadillidium vulgare]